MIAYTFKHQIGNISIFEDDGAIINIILQSDSFHKDTPTVLIKNVQKQIEEYLDGTRKTFDFKYQIKGTEFEQKVLNVMKSIPYGETYSYSKLAALAGYKGASRAAGSVCRKNKIPLLFPCHRVIKSNGDIGFFTGGVKLKKMLLNIEGKITI